MQLVPEYLGQLVLAAQNTDYQLPNGIPNDYAMAGLTLTFRGRLTVGVAAIAPSYGAPFSAIERIAVDGQFPKLGQQTIFDLTGRQTLQLNRVFEKKMPYMDPDNLIVGAGAAAAYDIQFQLPVPFWAVGMGHGSRRATLCPGNMASNPLRLIVRRGADVAIGVTGAGSTYAWAAFGGGGAPTVDVTRWKVKQGAVGKGVPSVLLCKHTRQGPFATAAAAVDLDIARLNVGNLITRMLLVNGAQYAAAPTEMTAGTLANLTRIRLKQNSMPMWNFNFRDQHLLGGPDTLSGAYLTAQGPAGGVGAFALQEMLGECLLDFCPDGNLDDALNTVSWSALGQSLILNGDITALALGEVEVITEELSRIQ